MKIEVDTDTGMWAGSLTYAQQLRIAAGMLPGLPENLLDGWYSTWISNDPPADAVPAHHIVELRIIVDTREAAVAVAAQLHAALGDRENEPLVAFKPLASIMEPGPRTDSIATHPQAVRVYRDGMQITKEQ